MTTKRTKRPKKEKQVVDSSPPPTPPTPAEIKAWCERMWNEKGLFNNLSKAKYLQGPLPSIKK